MKARDNFVTRQIWWQSFVSNVCTHAALQISRVKVTISINLVNSRIKTVLLLVFVEFFWELPSLASRQPGTSGSTTGQTRSVFLVAAENVDAGTWIVPILPVVLPAMLGCVASRNLSHWALYHGGSWQVFVVCSWEFVYVCHHEYCLLISVWYIYISYYHVEYLYVKLHGDQGTVQAVVPRWQLALWTCWGEPFVEKFVGFFVGQNSHS